jgi:hypothetical protein
MLPCSLDALLCGVCEGSPGLRSLSIAPAYHHITGQSLSKLTRLHELASLTFSGCAHSTEEEG